MRSRLQRHYTENLKQIFPEMKLGGLSTNSYIHISVSDLYNPTMGSPIYPKVFKMLMRQVFESYAQNITKYVNSFHHMKIKRRQGY
jgi:hypothetical protein